VSGQQIPLAMIRNPRARRYVLRLRPNGSARVTIPRGGSAAEARRFAERKPGLGRARTATLRHAPNPTQGMVDRDGDSFSRRTREDRGGRQWRKRSDSARQRSYQSDRPDRRFASALERFLWRLAAKELPSRVLEYATVHQVPVRWITVRNQRSRWGSCSRRGTISLNWRLIQAPPFVCDYLILHDCRT